MKIDLESIDFADEFDPFRLIQLIEWAETFAEKYAKEGPFDLIRWLKIVVFIENLKVPSGVGQGEPMRLREWQAEFLFHVYAPVLQTNHSRRRVRRALLTMARKNGKGLALDTPLPTPNGWTTMGAVRVGDTLFDETGAECRVTYTSDLRELDCYRVTFSNGEQIVCDGDHLWQTMAITDSHQSNVRDTREIFATQDGGRGRNNHSVRMPDPIQGRETALPIDPYVLGAWLGDGDSEAPRLTCQVFDFEHMQSALRGAGYVVNASLNRALNCRVSFSQGKTGRKSNAITPFKALGVWQNKHIPAAYLRAPFAQRLALLQGLMDTDGTISKAGDVISWSQSEPALTAGFCELLSSLGIKWTKRKRPPRAKGDYVCREYDVVQFVAHSDTLPVFRMKRKLARMRKVPKGKAHSRTVQIVSVEKVPTVHTKCIQVDSPNSLFLCGRTMLPTHNTAIASALVLVHLCGPEAKPNSEVVSAAVDREQAGVVFKMAKQMVELDEELKELVRPIGSQKRLVCYHLGTYYVALSADAANKHGSNPSFAIYDELAQAPSDELYNVLDTSFGAQEDGLFLIISTQSDDPQSIMSALVDDALALEAGTLEDPYFYGKVYSFPGNPDDPNAPDIYDPTLWHTANPALGDFKVEEHMLALARKAKRSASAEAAFRNLELNQRVSGTQRFVSSADWRMCEGWIEDSELVGLTGYAALDLSSRLDLTAATIVIPTDKGVAIRQKFWHAEMTPNELKRKERNDRAPYREWAKKGFLKLVPGRSIDPKTVLDDLIPWFAQYNVKLCAYDKWHMEDILREVEKQQIPEDVLKFVEFSQGARHMSPAIEDLERAVVDHTLRHGNNPILTYCMGNVRTSSDSQGNRRFDKKSRNLRIDGAVTLAMAFRMTVNEPIQIAVKSVYEERGFVTL